MTEQLLDGANVCARLEKMSSEGVSQRVDSDTRQAAADGVPNQEPVGCKSCAVHKQTPELAFSTVKSVTGYRQTPLLRLDNAKDKWHLAVLNWNIK